MRRKALVSVASLAFAIFGVSALTNMGCGQAVERRSSFAETLPPDGGEEAGPTIPSLGDPQKYSDDGGCSNSETKIERVPVVIEFVVDESTSMNSNGKWVAARDAMLAALDDMNTTADPGTFVGMLLYGDDVAEIAPDQIGVGAHHTALKKLINKPKGEGITTYTKMALTAGYKAVEKFKAPDGFVVDKSNRAVVLLSDGEPTDDEPEGSIEDLVGQKFAPLDTTVQSVVTFSVGIGPFPSISGYDPRFMGRVAMRGGTAPTGCDPNANSVANVCHFQVTPGSDITVTKQALLDAINKIRTLTASCEFAFEVGKNSDVNKTTVTVTDEDGNKTTIPKDEENGWTFDDPEHPTKVILHGDACSSSAGTVASGKVDVQFGCSSAK